MGKSESTPMGKCESCGQEFYYEPSHHRCPGEWESMTTPMHDPYAGMTWTEECLAKLGVKR